MDQAVTHRSWTAAGRAKSRGLKMDHSAMHAEIRRLAKEKGAVILAHNYQRPEVQDVADFVGDSLGLSRQAAAAKANMTVFCGVHFMAETAAILAPDRPVILPDEEAGCPMADMVTVAGLRKLKAEHPDAVVVAYVNTSADIKAETDVCCTSANAVDVIRSVPKGKEIIFTPDRNLGTWAAARRPAAGSSCGLASARPTGSSMSTTWRRPGPRIRTPRSSSTRSARATWWLSPTRSRAPRG